MYIEIILILHRQFNITIIPPKNMKIVNTGSSRVVFLTKLYAIKIPRFYFRPENEFYGRVISLLEGWKANRYEYIWYKSKMYDYFCPVKYSFFFSLIIVMIRAEPLSVEEFSNLNKYSFEGYEHKLNSLGKIKSKIVIVDYG